MIKHKHGMMVKKNGWNYLAIFGKPYDRGFSHGYLVAPLLKHAKKIIEYICWEENAQTWNWFVSQSNILFKPYIKKHYPELLQELQGIADGSTKNNSPFTLDEIIAWNGFIPLVEYWYPNHISNTTEHKTFRIHHEFAYKKDRCSAFIAVNSYTKDKKIVMAHNTFDDFLMGQLCNVILSIHPDKGHKILMQTYPGWIWSGTDFFCCSSGIFGTETTIGGFYKYKKGNPIFCRIRQCMQYASSLKEYEKIILHNNTGGYANSWLFGDLHHNQIMRIELGLQYHKTEIKNDGYFIGFNAPYDPKIRTLECHNTGFYDIRRHQGARRKRLSELMELYKGKIDEKIAKKILSDHYDVYLKKINPCSRTIDSHYELDAREYMSQSDRPKPFQPRGALDGKVITSNMAKDMTFFAKWGCSSNIPFLTKKFFKEHSEWIFLKDYLNDRPVQSWTLFKCV